MEIRAVFAAFRDKCREEGKKQQLLLGFAEYVGAKTIVELKKMFPEHTRQSRLRPLLDIDIPKSVKSVKHNDFPKEWLEYYKVRYARVIEKIFTT